MKYQYHKSMKLPKRRQEKIYCMCQVFDCLTQEMQRLIIDACNSTGYGDAVFEYISTDATSEYICHKYNTNHMRLAMKSAEAFRTIAQNNRCYKSM